MDDFRPLLAKVQQEYKEGHDFIKPKRDIYLDRMHRDAKKRRQKDVVVIDTVKDAIETMLAVYYTDALTCVFASRDGYIHQDRADNWNALAEFDQKEADYQQLSYMAQYDRLFYGVGIRIKKWWDDVRKCAIFESVDPLTWIPDPQSLTRGVFTGGDFRFHGFELKASFYELKYALDYNGERLYDEKALYRLIAKHEGQKERENIVSLMGGYGQLVDNYTEDFMCSIYHHYTIRDGKKWLVTTDGDQSTVLRAVELTLVWKEEKKDPMLLKYPVILNYLSPKRYDPFWESVWDWLEDKQRAKSILANLSILRAEKAAGLNDKVWNLNLVNKDDVLRPSQFGKNIFVTPKVGETISDAVFTIPQENINSNAFNEMWFLDQEIAKRTAMDSQQYGLNSSGSATATELQIIQQNSNIRSILRSKINAWGEYEFWYQWMRSYKEFYSRIDEKQIVIDANFQYKTKTITKDDIITVQDPYIAIKQKSEQDALMEQQKLFYASLLASVQQNPAIPQSSKLMALREYMRYNKIHSNTIQAIVPLLPEERKAMNYLSMVNADIVPEGMINSETPPEWYSTYYVYLQKADNTTAKSVTLMALENQLATQPVQSQPTAWPELNSAANMMLAKAMNESGSVESRKSLAQ